MGSPDLGWSPAPGEILTVGELLGRARSLLETAFPWVWVEGEVGNLRIPASGHAYFTLGDAGAQLRAVCFRATLRLLATEPVDGSRVLARGRLTLYEARGDVQLVVEGLDPLGEGLLRLELQERKRRLAAEGLFDAARKRPLPSLPRAVGVVSSPAGAAVQDILKVLGRRAPGVSVYLAPARVQGRGASEQLREALVLASGHPEVEVVILGRGGGSAEDLSAFNDEELVRAVAACPVPIISAVGHETDLTLVDLAADARAPTPSAAAEMACREWGHGLEQVQKGERALASALRYRISDLRVRLGRLEPQARAPGARIDRLRIRTDRALEALEGVAERALAQRRVCLAAGEARLASLDPERRRGDLLTQLGSLEERMVSGVRRRLERGRRELTFLECGLQNLNPFAVLSRGYAVVRKADAVVRDAAQCSSGERLNVTLARGALECTVDSVLPSGGRS